MKGRDEGKSQLRLDAVKWDRKEYPRPSREADRSETPGFLKPGAISFLIHVVLVLFLLFSLRAETARPLPSVYRVTLRPLATLGDGKPPGGPGPGVPGPGGGFQAPAPAEKPKPAEPRKGPEVLEAPRAVLKKESKKPEKPESGKTALSPKTEKPQPEQGREATRTGLKPSAKKDEKPQTEKPQGEKAPGRSLQEALDDIRRKAALEDIQKRIAQRGQGEKSSGEAATARPFAGPVTSSSKDLPGSVGSGTGPGAGSGAGTGKGVGPGTGTGGSPAGSRWGTSPYGSTEQESRLNQYYSMIWAKIKEGWTLPENLAKEKTDLETIIVVVIERDGGIQKAWFEKKSGNALYDQMAMRALRKAEPLPPIPREFSDTTFEIGIRFHPD